MQTIVAVRMKTFLGRIAAVLLALAMVCCGHGGPPMVDGGPTLSAEEMRVAASQHIDSSRVEVWTGDSVEVAYTPHADTIDVRELLCGLTAEAWILVDDSSGVLISAKNAHQRRAPASLTKMMTCLLALQRGTMGDTIEITDDVFLAKNSQVRRGDRYLLGNLIHEMMLLSDNDAANAVAKHVGGSIEAFCQLMNAKADSLGMSDTRFANPNGMPNDSAWSTARDLLVLARYCMRDSAFAKIVGTANMDIPLVDGRHLPCPNTNQLLENYEGCTGVKTGYTQRAGYCLASSATRHGRSLFLILLGSQSLPSRFSESATLLDYGFRVMDEVRGER